MAVTKQSSAVACSPLSFDDAIRIAVDRETATSGGITDAWIRDQRILVENGKIVQYCVHLHINYRG